MSKKKTPDGEKCERTLPFKLNDEEKARKGEIAGGLNKKLEEAMEAKSVEMKKHNAKIKDLQMKVSAQLKMVHEGIERRAVTCIEVKNYDKNMIEFWFEGEILETKTMTPADRQLDLKDQKPKKGQEKWQKLAPKHPRKGDPLSEEDEKKADIASVHKLETSRKGASSSVDPK